MLNARQVRFVQEYILDLNATQAAVRAGYSAKTAYSQGQRLLKHVEIGAALQQARLAAAERSEISIAWVLAGLKENFERAMQAEPVLDNKGKETGEYVYQGAVANRALELIGKQLGMFVERSVIEATVRNLDALTDDQLAQVAAGTVPPDLRLVA